MQERMYCMSVMCNRAWIFFSFEEMQPLALTDVSAPHMHTLVSILLKTLEMVVYIRYAKCNPLFQLISRTTISDAPKVRNDPQGWICGTKASVRRYRRLSVQPITKLLIYML